LSIPIAKGSDSNHLQRKNISKYVFICLIFLHILDSMYLGIFFSLYILSIALGSSISSICCKKD
jgi:hypothetical protein